MVGRKVDLKRSGGSVLRHVPRKLNTPVLKCPASGRTAFELKAKETQMLTLTSDNCATNCPGAVGG